MLLHLPKELILLTISLLDTSSRFSFKSVSRSCGCLGIMNVPLTTVIVDVISNNHTHLFKWIVSHKRRLSKQYGRYYCRLAALVGGFEIIKHIYRKTYDDYYFGPETTLVCAASEGHFDIVKWLYANGCRLTPLACDKSVANGHLEIVKWLRDNGCQLTSQTCDVAILHGRIEIVRWLYENGYPLGNLACHYAARNGHLEILKLLLPEIGKRCFWNDWTCYEAAQNGHIDVLKYLHENGCRCDASTYAIAVENNDLELLTWLDEIGCPHSESDYDSFLKCLTKMMDFD